MTHLISKEMDACMGLTKVVSDTIDKLYGQMRPFTLPSIQLQTLYK